MSDFHLAYLNLGSNIQAETHLVRAVELLHEYGEVLNVSSAWESKSVGAEGPNYLNACVLFKTNIMQAVRLKHIINRVVKFDDARFAGIFLAFTIFIDFELSLRK